MLNSRHCKISYTVQCAHGLVRVLAFALRCSAGLIASVPCVRSSSSNHQPTTRPRTQTDSAHARARARAGQNLLRYCSFCSLCLALLLTKPPRSNESTTRHNITQPLQLQRQPRRGCARLIFFVRFLALPAFLCTRHTPSKQRRRRRSIIFFAGPSRFNAQCSLARARERLGVGHRPAQLPVKDISSLPRCSTALGVDHAAREIAQRTEKSSSHPPSLAQRDR